MRSLCLAAVLALAAAPATAAPFAILDMNEAVIELVDLGSLGFRGERARYAKAYVAAAAARRSGQRGDHTIHRMEADCVRRRVRVLQIVIPGKPPRTERADSASAAWRGAGDDELRLACTGQLGGLQVIPSLDVARAIVNAGSGRIAD